jgi:outer membrane protein TolC
MLMKKIIYTVSILLTANISFAQVQANTELKGLINEAFSYFPKIKEAENNVITAQQQVDVANTNMPVVTGTAAYAYVEPKIVIPFPTGTNGATENFQFAPVNNVNTELDATYALIDFGRLKANVEKAKQGLKYATDNVDYAKSQLAFQVATIYYNMIYLQKAIAIQDSVLAYLHDNLKIVTSKLQNGDAIKLDELNIQSSIDNELNIKTDLVNQLQKQTTLLTYTTGVAQTAGTNFDFDVPFKNTDDALTQAQANNLDFLLQADKTKQAQADIDIIKSTNKPSVDLHGSTGFKNGYVPAVGEDRFNYNAGVTFKIPIYDGSKTKKQIKLQEDIVKQNQLATETLNHNYKKDIFQAYIDIQSNLERIQNTQGQIDEATSAEQIAKSRYQNGVGTNLDITNASNFVQRAELTRLQYQYQLCLAKVQLANLLGYKYW